jgi:hypothetical protein
MGLNVDDVLRKVVVYYTKKHKDVKKLKTDYDLKSLLVLKQNIKFTRNKNTFKNSFI